MREWFEDFNDNFWLKGDDTGEDDARHIMQVLKLQPGMRVLDCPCGAGRVASHLARAGCAMTGIDRNPSFIARAQRRFADEGFDGDFRVLDMRQLEDRESYDGIYNWGGSFGYFSDEVNLNVLRLLAIALKPGGRLLIDQPNRERVLRHFQTEVIWPGGRNVDRWFTETQRVEGTWYRDDLTQPSRSSMRLYTPSQFRRLFTRAGLAVETIYAGKDGGEYTRGCRRVSVVGQKA